VAVEFRWDRVSTLLGERNEYWLAGQVGVSRSTYASWKRLGIDPKGKHVLALSKVLGVPPETFYDLPDSSTDRASWTDVEFDNWVQGHRQLLEKLRELESRDASEMEEVAQFAEFRRSKYN